MTRWDAPRVGISGSYGGLNLGDEAILQSIVAQLRGDFPRADITVLTRNAADTVARHDVQRAVDPRRMSRTEARAMLEPLDLLILGGGGILYTDDAESYLREVFLAKEVGTPVLVYAVSVGPLATRGVRERVREAMELADVVTVRGRASGQLLDEIGVTREVEVTADPALLLLPEPLSLDEIQRREGIPPGARLIALSVREPGPAAPDLDTNRCHQLLADAADFVADRLDAEVVFFPLELVSRTSDVQRSHDVIGRMRHARRARVLKGDYRPGQMISLLHHFDLAIGMRLHFCIFSALAGVPLAPLAYASKVRAFLEDLGVAGPSIQDVSTGELIAHVDRVWDARREQQERVRAALDDLQRRARRTHDHAARLLSRGPTRPRVGATTGAAATAATSARKGA